MLFLELLGEVVDDPHVKVFTAKEGVAIGGLHLKETIVNLEDGHVKGAAAKVIDGDGMRIFLVQTIGQRSRRRFVDDAQHFETGDFTGVLGGLTLCVVEIGGHGDDGLRHLFAEIALGGFFHLAEDEGGNLRGTILLAACLNPSVAVTTVNHGERHVLLVFGEIGVVSATADKALHTKDRVFRIGHGLPFGRLTHKTLCLGECDDGGGGARTFGVFDHAGLRAVHDRDAAVGGAEVNTNNFGHVVRSLLT